MHQRPHTVEVKSPSVAPALVLFENEEGRAGEVDRAFAHFTRLVHTSHGVLIAVRVPGQTRRSGGAG
jgi:hypothetical protein